jgi:23S rRNA (uridine2552-2'-O)-methyltransferase
MTRRRGKNPYQGDPRTRAAKASGYPARSVFKLEEIDRRFGLFRTGQRVLDLGAAPGSWTLFAAGRIGPGGTVLAIDIAEIRQAFPSNVEVLRADALALDAEAPARHAPYDVVLSDMAPSTSGDKLQDQARSHELFDAALGVASRHLRPGGAFVGKLFMSAELPEARAALAELFESHKLVRPKGTRQASSEIYLVGLGRRGGDD